MESRDRWQIFLLLFIVLLLGIGVLVGFSFLKNKKTPTSSPKNKTLLKTYRDSDLNLAQKNLDWLVKQTDNDGFLLEKSCGPKDCSEETNVNGGNRDGLIFFWSKIDYLNRVNDKKAISETEDQLVAFLKAGKGDDFLICSVATDLNSNTTIKTTTKNLVKNLCLMKPFISLDDVQNYWTDNSKKMSAKYSAEDGIAKTKKYDDWNDYLLTNGRGFHDYLTIPMELVAKYKLTKNISNLDLANQYFDLIKKQMDNRSIYNGEDRCLAGLSATELYSVKPLDKYLDFGKNLNSEIESGRYDDANYNGPFCTWFFKNMYQITEDQKYLDKAYDLIDSWSKISFDGDGGLNKKDNDNGFFNGNNLFDTKNILNNGLIIKTLTL